MKKENTQRETYYMKIFDRKLKSKITVFLKKNLKSCPLCAGQSFVISINNAFFIFIVIIIR